MLQHTYRFGLILVACTACVQDETLDIAGTYDSAFGATVEISETEISVSYGTPDTYAVASFDNAAGQIVAQNASNNSYNPDLWSRFEWAFVGDDLYYCQQVTSAETEDAAVNADPSDTTDPTAGGCGIPANNFAFTLLTPQG